MVVLFFFFFFFFLREILDKKIANKIKQAQILEDLLDTTKQQVQAHQTFSHCAMFFDNGRASSASSSSSLKLETLVVLLKFFFFFFFFFLVSAPSLHLKQMKLRFYVCKSHPPSH
jgi:hypothetical protein